MQRRSRYQLTQHDIDNGFSHAGTLSTLEGNESLVGPLTKETTLIPTKPAVQHNCKDAYRIISSSRKHKRWEKRNANRRHRRAFNAATRRMTHDPERFYDEGFNAPSLSSWDLC